MSASEKIGIKSLGPGTKIGIIAGGGAMPANVYKGALDKGFEPTLFALKGQADEALLKEFDPEWVSLGGAGGTIKKLKKLGIQDIILIGSVRRPSLADLKPDATTLAFFAKHGKKALGDDGLLVALKGFLEGKGFVLHGAQDFAAGNLIDAGLLGACSPTAQDEIDIARGIQVLEHLSALDIGQAVIVQQGLVLGVEAAEGTKVLIERCAEYKRTGGGGVLVKMPKKGQNTDLDLPTIGPETISSLASCGFVGIVLKAGASFIINPDEIKRLADVHGIFVQAK